MDHRPIHTILYAHDPLAPADLDDREVSAWLAAPVAGQPLFRRMLEHLVGLDVRSIHVVGGPQARVFADLTQQFPCFGMTAIAIEECDIPFAEDERVLVLPASGLLSVSIRSMVEVASRPIVRLADVVGGHSRSVAFSYDVADSRAPYHGAFGANGDFLGPHALRETLGMDLLPCGTGSLTPVNTPFALLEACLGSVGPGATTFEPSGRQDNGALVGPRSTLHPSVTHFGSSAIGCNTRVGKDVRLRDAVIGRRCLVHDRAVLDSCLVLDDSRIRAGETCRNCIRIRGRQIPVNYPLASVG